MNIIRVNTDGIVVETLKCNSEFTNENIKVVNGIPAFVAKDGYVGVLKYNDENGIYWDYVEDVPVGNIDITSDELLEMIEEVM